MYDFEVAGIENRLAVLCEMERALARAPDRTHSAVVRLFCPASARGLPLPPFRPRRPLGAP
jgi:hypothetical protein